MRRETRGENPDSPYLNTRISSITAVLEMRTSGDERASTLAGRALMRKPRQTSAQ
jgi:hypothetical protein